MGEGLDRRKVVFGTLASAVAAALPPSTEAQAREADYLPSTLDIGALEKQKADAADAIISNFWGQEPLREHVLQNYFPDARNVDDVRNALIRSSRMEIPSAAECAEVERRSFTNTEIRRPPMSRLAELGQNIAPDKYGLYLDGDTQKLYLMKKLPDMKKQFIKSFLVSTSRTGWSNTQGSHGTPLGLHRIVERRVGKLGQVVSTLNPYDYAFRKLPVQKDGRELGMKPFAKKLHSGGEPAELITAAYLLWGPTTPISRGEYLHGTNREDALGSPHSGGCIRMTSLDVCSLLGTDEKGVPYVEAGALRKDGRSVIGGTPVMIHASPDKRPKQRDEFQQVPERISPKTVQKKESKKKTEDLTPKKTPKKKDPDGWEDITGR